MDRINIEYPPVDMPNRLSPEAIDHVLKTRNELGHKIIAQVEAGQNIDREDVAYLELLNTLLGKQFVLPVD